VVELFQGPVIIRALSARGLHTRVFLFSEEKRKFEAIDQGKIILEIKENGNENSDYGQCPLP
jgi:hypothetical protein